MALLFMDGFAAGDQLKKWASAGTVAQSTAGGRFPDGYFLSDGVGYAVSRTHAATNEIIVGHGFYETVSSWSTQLRYSGTSQVSVRLNDAGIVEIRRGTNNGSLLASGTRSYAGRWTYVEVKAKIANSGGRVEVRINGSSEPEVVYEGDTQNTTTDLLNNVYITLSSHHKVRICDVYICDTTGPVNNDFLGDVRVRTMVPASNGTSSQWTGSDSDSTDNYAHVDELPYSSTDYITSGTPGHTDLYGLTGGLPTTGLDIKAIAVNMQATKTDTGAATVQATIKSDATTDASTAHNLSTSVTSLQSIWETDPDTSTAWTPDAVNALEAGVTIPT